MIRLRRLPRSVAKHIFCIGGWRLKVALLDRQWIGLKQRRGIARPDQTVLVLLAPYSYGT
jgi:hypothetical protein